MNLRSLISQAKTEGASDLHIEPGLAAGLARAQPVALRRRTVAPALTSEWARDLIDRRLAPFRGTPLLRSFQSHRGLRCRVNVMHTARGVGFAIRLLPAFQPTLEALNLHPDLKQLAHHPHGLVLISGPTGCGKSTTLAALIQTINLSDARHIVTIENPIEFTFRPRRSFIRQREVGRDTPSFEQALLDSLREDPDVLMVGEMREPETMRLTLSAAETGHLVLATVHSSNCAEALQRVVGAFPAEIQNNVAAQLADCLIGVVSQRLQFRPGLNICVPECEVLMSTLPIKNFIRNRDFFKIVNSVETGAEHGMWTFQRYRAWLDKRTSFHLPSREPEVEEEDTRPSSQVHAPAAGRAAAPPVRAPPPRSSPAHVRTHRSRADRNRGDGNLREDPQEIRLDKDGAFFPGRELKRFDQRRKICFISSVAVSRSRSNLSQSTCKPVAARAGSSVAPSSACSSTSFCETFGSDKKLKEPLGRLGVRTIADHPHRVGHEERLLRDGQRGDRETLPLRAGNVIRIGKAKPRLPARNLLDNDRIAVHQERLVGRQRAAPFCQAASPQNCRKARKCVAVVPKSG
jgi:twitching motility protein PilT